MIELELRNDPWASPDVMESGCNVSADPWADYVRYGTYRLIAAHNAWSWEPLCHFDDISVLMAYVRDNNLHVIDAKTIDPDCNNIDVYAVPSIPAYPY